MSAAKSGKKKTTVGVIDEDVLAFTAGRDVVLDLSLVQADCIGSAAHVTMLSKLPLKPALFKASERKAVIEALVAIARSAKRGTFRIKTADQDVHMAVERVLTAKLGALGKRIHTGRSRNDQVTVDLRIYGKQQLSFALLEAVELAGALTSLAQKYVSVPMVGRTHMQPAMPSSVGLWASAHAESLLDDIVMLMNAYELNDQCPLGAAAGYGVPLPLDRQMVSDLLGFSRPARNVLYAVSSRGKIEAVIISALGHVMTSLSRLAEDLILYSMPEFGYFELPAEFCTGSSIMPQKKNPDVLELVRAKAAVVVSQQVAVQGIMQSLPYGYNRDVQETKALLMESLETARTSLRIMTKLVKKLKVHKKALLADFSPSVFATDKALQLVAEGIPFRDAYKQVKKGLDDLKSQDPHAAIAAKTSLGATAGLDFAATQERLDNASAWVREEQDVFNKAMKKLLGTGYPI